METVVPLQYVFPLRLIRRLTQIVAEDDQRWLIGRDPLCGENKSSFGSYRHSKLIVGVNLSRTSHCGPNRQNHVLLTVTDIRAQKGIE
jgi:hypothetical protein